MTRYAALCDDFYVNLNLSTETELPHDRGSSLHFFEQLRKKYPTMRNFYARDSNDLVLEEDKDDGNYRWVSVESKRLCSGYVNPSEISDATDMHLDILDSVPHSLSISPLDCETLNLTYGFDFAYQGNQHQLLFDALGMSPAFEKALEIPGGRLVAFDPVVQMALDPECRIQFRLNIEPRTTAFQIRTGEYSEENLSVFMTVRKYGSIDQGETYASTFRDLMERATMLVDDYVTDNILVPLQNAILIN